MTTLNLPKPDNPNTALEIYHALIRRIKEKIQKQKSVVFDPETGIQKIFLDGKLIAIKQVRITK